MLPMYFIYRIRNGKITKILHVNPDFLNYTCLPEVLYEFVEKNKDELRANGVRIRPYNDLPFEITETLDETKRFIRKDEDTFFDEVLANPSEMDMRHMDETGYLRDWCIKIHDFHHNAYVHWLLYIKEYPRFARRFLGYVLPCKMREYRNLGGDPERPGSDPHGQEIKNIEQAMETLEKEGKLNEGVPEDFWKCLEERYVVPAAEIREAMEEKLMAQNASPEEKAEPPAEAVKPSKKQRNRLSDAEIEQGKMLIREYFNEKKSVGKIEKSFKSNCAAYMVTKGMSGITSRHLDSGKPLGDYFDELWKEIKGRGAELAGKKCVKQKSAP
jgi:hypothetical protein